MVEPPPKPEEKKPEEEKAQETPPPPPEEKPKEPPQPPAPSQMPNVAIRPGPTQMDERDEPGQQEAGGQEQKTPDKQDEAPQPVTPPSPDTVENEPKPEPPPPAPTAEQGEIAATNAPLPDNMATVAVPTSKPEVTPTPAQPAKAPPDGEVDPNLKPAKKILVGAKRPGPMLRQIMGNLPPRERVGQLCVAEAMAQIKDERKGHYDGLEPHTGKNYPIVGNIMDAKGAFNVGTQWFPIDYRCEVDIDNYLVTDFRYKIGPKLSPEDVKRLGLILR
jgi:hypothetical protein